MALATHLKPSFFNFFTKSPSFFFNHTNNRAFLHLLQLPSLLSPQTTTKDTILKSPFSQKHHLYTSTAAAALPSHQSPTPTDRKMSKKAQHKAYRESAVGILRKKLDMCSSDGDLTQALLLYDDARSKEIPLGNHHYNSLLYLCSSCDVLVDSDEQDEKSRNLGLRRGFEIFEQMGNDGVSPNEATFTNVARLAAKMEDPDMAFEMLKKMMGAGIPPKLRSYDPALFGFVKKREADQAYKVDAHMLANGIVLEEPQLSALLRVSVDVGRADKVYEMLHRLRVSVRQVSDYTAEIIEEWFKSREGMEVGQESWDVEKVKEGVVKGGGGWHGQGWLGKGEWKVVKTEMDEKGVCSCGERLVSIDIDPLETENFANLLSNLACKKEVTADFNAFQDWLRCNGPFDAVIDGANVSLNNSHSFSFFQLNAVVGQVHKLSPTKRLPLIILHTSRVVGGPANNPNNKKLIEKWRSSGALYITPKGSNDDWYWLYAAVNSKCLLVTNDEMRDHLFQLLGTSFFPRWKEKHQVRINVSRQGTSLRMPPPYSIVIQESERGSWHIPIVTGDDIEAPRQWVCATRESTTSNSTVS